MKSRPKITNKFKRHCRACKHHRVDKLSYVEAHSCALITVKKSQFSFGFALWNENTLLPELRAIKKPETDCPLYLEYVIQNA